ncbi:MAG: acyl-CoA dehydratase activase-related protein [Anaerovoracaceae bacterium]
MRVGIPRSFFYYAYKPFVETFFQKLEIPVEYPGLTDQNQLNNGIKECVDEACFPIKLFQGQMKTLANTCDLLMVPRIMTTEYGESICPKIAGLPELAAQTVSKDRLVFTDPMYLDDQRSFRKMLWKNCRKLGVKKSVFKRAFLAGIFAQTSANHGIQDEGYTYNVFLAGHPYNVYDPFANLDLLQKLHRLNIGVVTEERVSRKEKERGIANKKLIKKPYWSFFVNTFGSIKALNDRGIDGVIYLSSFSCGTDSFTLEMLKNNLGDLPLLVLKLDQQRGEAGFDTRLEAFYEVLKGRE